MKWSKSPFVKGIIRSQALKSFRDYCQDLVSLIPKKSKRMLNSSNEIEKVEDVLYASAAKEDIRNLFFKQHWLLISSVIFLIISLTLNRQSHQHSIAALSTKWQNKGYPPPSFASIKELERNLHEHSLTTWLYSQIIARNCLSSSKHFKSPICKELIKDWSRLIG
jgi:hypothetical protein